MASELTEDELARLEALWVESERAGEWDEVYQADHDLARAAREALPRLTAEVRRLRALADESMQLVETRTRERDEARAKLGRVRKAGRKLLSEVERNTCIHEETERLGVIRTRCTMCGRKWADDQGGFQPYEEPSWLEKARELLSKGDDDGK